MTEFIKKHKWPLIVFSAAFLLRLIYLLQYRSNPAFNYPMVDELWHLNWAGEIIGGNFWGDEAYFRGPLYPYLLAGFLLVTGKSLFLVRFLQIIIASFSAIMVFLLGRRVFSEKIGVISGLAYAAYGTIIFYETMLLIPVVFIFLNLLAVYLLLKHKGEYNLKRWLLAGLIAGLSAIARPNILILMPFFLIWIYFGFTHFKEVKKRLLVPLVYLMGVLIPVFSVTARNLAVTGEAILISSQGGVNLYIGNNPDTEGLTMMMPEIKLNEALPWDEFTLATREAAEREVGHKLTAGEESSFWTGKAIDFIISNPIDFIGITLKKTLYFVLGFENSDQTDIYQSRVYSSLSSILIWKKPIYFPFGLVFPLGLVGMILCWKKRRELALFYVFVIGYVPTVVLFLVTARHRLTVIPFLIIFGAYAVIALGEMIRKQNWKKVSIYSLIFIIVLIFTNRTYFDIGFENVFQTHFNLALTYERQGNLPAAEKEYRAALQEYPYSATTLNNLGNLLYRTGRYDEALTYFQKSIGAEPEFADAYNNIGLIYEARNDFENAERYYRKAAEIDPRLHQAYINLGDIYLSKKEYARAEEYYRDAMQIAPEVSDVYYKIGALYGRMQKFTEAEEMFHHGSELGEPRPIDCVNWGNIYFSTRRPREALALYHRAISRDSTFTQAYFNLAVTFANYGNQSDSARVYLNKLLRANPDFQPARELLQRLEGGR